MLNKVVLMGRLTKEPEMRRTSTDIPVCHFTLAIDRGWKKDETDFINVIAWRNTAEFCQKYVLKGQRIVVSGRLQTRTWETEDGNKKYFTDVIADEVFFADSKKMSSNSLSTETLPAEAIMEAPDAYVLQYADTSTAY